MSNDNSQLLQVLISQGEENNKTNKELADSIRDLTSKVEKSLDKHELTDKEILSFQEFKERAKPILDRAEKDQEFMDGLKTKIIYTLLATIVTGICVGGGLMIYDNAGKNNQHQQSGVK